VKGSPHKTAERLRTARFYGILDAAYLVPAQFAPVCRAMIEGGADIIQLRAKNADKSTCRALLESILPQFEKNDIPLIVNDHIDIALAYPRCGLHIGQDDEPVAKARALLGPNRILGLSTHSVEQAAQALELAGFLSYFCIGPVFATRTKPDYKPVGLELVRAVHTLNAGRLPLFCIGGINRSNVAKVLHAGAERIVAVSDVLHANNPAQTVRELRAAICPAQ
jgi:thiamine-phosphate pyrophosphorylase